jgi:hypothetical protein
MLKAIVSTSGAKSGAIVLSRSQMIYKLPHALPHVARYRLIDGLCERAIDGSCLSLPWSRSSPGDRNRIFMLDRR